MLKEMMFQFIETPGTKRHSVYFLDGRAHYTYLNVLQDVQMQVVLKSNTNVSFEMVELLIDKSMLEIECIDFIQLNPLVGLT
jgi:hypothetical protein